MTDTFTLDQPTERPDLPDDRTQAASLIERLRERGADVEAMGKVTGLPWATSMVGRRLDGVAVDDAMKDLESAQEGVRELMRHLDIVHPAPGGPATLTEASVFLDEVAALAGAHREAAIAANVADLDPERLEAVTEDCRHLQRIEKNLLDAVDQDVPSEERERALRDAAAASDALRDEFGIENLDAAVQKRHALSEETSSIERRVRRLTVLAARLDLQDATTGELARIAKACGQVRSVPRDLLSLIQEAGPEMRQAVIVAREKAARIVHAGGLLDSRFGTAWRNEPVDRLTKAAGIAEIPSHPGHGKVAEYAASFGLTGSRLREHLAAVAKTRSGQDAFLADPVLLRALPRSFRGLETDFDTLSKAADIRADLDAALAGIPGGDRVVAGLASKTPQVVDEFLGFADLEQDALSLPFDKDTPLRRLRMLHEDRIRRIDALVLLVHNLPVPEERRTPSDARRLGRMLREIEGTRARISESPEFAASGALSPRDFLSAMDWRARLFTLLPEGCRPRGDHGYAQLHVNAKAGATAAMQLRGKLANLSRIISPDAVPSADTRIDGFADILATAKAIEPVMHAQVLVCETMDEILACGLRSFVIRMTEQGHASAAWGERLSAEYAVLDQLAEEDAFAASVNAAVVEAEAPTLIEAELPVVDAPQQSFDPAAFDSWIEEEIGAVIQASRTDQMAVAE